MGALGGALMMKYIPAGMAAPLVILLVVLASVLIGMIFCNVTWSGSNQI